MAGSLQCDNHPEIEADFILGNARTGDQSFFCATCMGTVGLVMALEILNPDDVAAAAAEKAGKTAANGAERPGKTPGRKRAKKAAAGQPDGAAGVPRAAGTEPAADRG